MSNRKTTTQNTPADSQEWEEQAAVIHEEAVATDAATGAVADEQRVKFDDVALRNIDSFAAAEELLRAAGIEIEDASDVMGTGFAILEDKSKLEDVPLIILAYDFHQGRVIRDGQPAFFSSMVLVTADGKKYIVNDGGSGIYRQLEDHALRAKKRGGLLVKGGLRASRYNHPLHGESETFYLNLSA